MVKMCVCSKTYTYTGGDQVFINWFYVYETLNDQGDGSTVFFSLSP